MFSRQMQPRLSRNFACSLQVQRLASSHSGSGNHSKHDPELCHVQKDHYLWNYLRSLTRPQDYWANIAENLVWHKKWDEVLDNATGHPAAKWFPGGEISICYNALDRHCDEGFEDQIALYHDSPVTNTKSSVTYKALLEEVRHLAGYLSSIGVKKGDRVIIYMPMIPQTVAAMLACARIGAIHSVVFGGFAAKELATRISHAKAVAVICGSGGIERGKFVNYKKIVDQAIELSDPKPKNVVVFQRPDLDKVELLKGRDSDWSESVNNAKPVDCVPVDANHPLYILYTSGTTGSPKAVVRPSAGYGVVLKWSMHNVFGMNPEDVWWAASDFGWVVGHSYICYAPLLHRNPSIVYEGKVTGTPNAGAHFRVAAEYNVKGMFSTPTAIRTIRQEDPHGEQRAHHKNNLKYMFIAGEHCDEETKSWARSAFGVPVLDNWWQTETGWPITSTCVGLGSTLNPPPNSSGHAVPGYDVRVVDSESGKEVKPGELGRILIKLPLPPGTFTSLWEQDELYRKTYFTKYSGFYDTMDAGSVDEDGYVSVMSRVDDIINVSGVRISLAAIEECILKHEGISECAVVGVKDKVRGQVPVALLVLEYDFLENKEQIVQEVLNGVRNEIGAVAYFKKACIVPRLPKTRSGKIARPSLVALAEARQVKIPVTIEDASVYPEIKKAMQTIGFAQGEFEMS